MRNKKTLQVSGWSNGSGYYGIKISKPDRDNNFKKGEIIITVHLPNQEISKSKIKENSSFWRKCHELRSPEINAWMIQNGYVKGGKKWEYRKPPKFILTEIAENEFELTT